MQAYKVKCEEHNLLLVDHNTLLTKKSLTIIVHVTLHTLHITVPLLTHAMKYDC
jgi:hypothetical protein